VADVIHGVVRAMACSTNGTPLATSAGLAPAQASRLAALAAGILGATRVHATTIELARGALVLPQCRDRGAGRGPGCPG
jgi:Roadblock/LC7 domain